MFTGKKSFTAMIAAGALALVGCNGDSGSGSAGSGDDDLQMQVLSSAHHQITGGDLRLAIDAPESEHDALALWLNDNPIGHAGLEAQSPRLEGTVEGLREGENTLELIHDQRGTLHTLTLVNHPSTGPVFSGPHQEPFVCTTTTELGIQPIVDTTEPPSEDDPAFAVRNGEGEIVGYSRHCSIEPFVEYLYRSTEGAWAPWPADGERPDDLATVTVDGEEVDFVVRREVGTINRFIYTLAMLADPDEAEGENGTDLWNDRLVYHFQGGVGIGHTQGRVANSRSLRPEVLARGYAIAYSTGTRTGEHYNLELGGETALMVKERFIEHYGAPLYTVGLGTSGGAVQQYVYAQNHPGLIDAGVADRSYPDMVTQTIHVGDCELLEHYMDVTDGDNEAWHITGNRSWLVGLNATDNVLDPLAEAKMALDYGTAPGSTECIESWRGLTPLTLNPLFGQARNQEEMRPEGVMDTVRWTHYDDLRNVYGLDEDGWARRMFDNVGVQYGLLAFRDGRITAAEFLDLNAKVGGWKHAKDMIQEGFPFLGDPTPEENFDPWSRRNMTLGDGESPAPRTQGDIEAMNAAYESGLVFDGQLDIPLIDYRHYLEHVLDMHNSHQSFAARQRISNRMDHADHQSIWFVDARPGDPQADRIPQALEALDEWLANLREDSGLSVADARPASASDRCFATDGELIAAGDDVWNGILDDLADGACTQQFPIHTTSRIEAGGPIEGYVFKCQLKPVATALEDGTYGSWTPNDEQIARLNAIFPDGVCDYDQPDMGRP